ncbi:FkbM family methyltransferase [Candidatus Zixiibacteriota bacterium]
MKLIRRIFKRIAEALTKRYFHNLLLRSYAQRGCKAHLLIMRWASIWYGLNLSGNVKTTLSNLYILFLHQAQLEIFEKGHTRSLGESPIGFENLQIICHSSDANSSLVYLYGFSDNLTYFDIYQQHIVAGSTTLDIGANLGIHTAVMSRCVGEQGHVKAYEPVGRIFERLQGTIQLNGLTNVDCRNTGVGDVPGTIGFDDLEGEFNIGKGQVRNGAKSSIPITTIDNEATEFTGRVSLMKIDVEGYELSVLRGAHNTLYQHKPILVCEFNPDTYSFSDFVEVIPYRSDFFQIPNSHREQLKPIHPDRFSCAGDILVLPK